VSAVKSEIRRREGEEGGGFEEGCRVDQVQYFSVDVA
jgi:hypothetical protein